MTQAESLVSKGILYGANELASRGFLYTEYLVLDADDISETTISTLLEVTKAYNTKLATAIEYVTHLEEIIQRETVLESYYELATNLEIVIQYESNFEFTLEIPVLSLIHI